jgi:molybdenum cofactor cytidylyltransferase
VGTAARIVTSDEKRMSTLPNRTNCRVTGIILAAGISSRIGEIKQLLAFRETTVLGQVLENVGRSRLDEVVVVLGHGAEEIRKAVNVDRAKLVVNEFYEQGQSTSLRAGLAAVSEDVEAVMFILGDQPLVGPEVIHALMDGYCRSKASIVLPTYQDRRGNPVMVDRGLFPRVESITGDVGARVLFDDYEEAIVEIPVQDDSIHFDLDTWEDYEELLERLGSR